MKNLRKNNLFGNEYNAIFLCEYQNEIKLIKKLINVSEAAIQKQPCTSSKSYEAVCYEFAKTIVEYSKVAIDNVLLGHFNAVKIIIRTILENLVCLDIIINDTKFDIWKYYWVQSYRESLYMMQRTPTQEEINRLYELYTELDISEDFFIKQVGEKKAYIQKPYGWTYKVHTKAKKQFTFEAVCKLVNSTTEYQGYKTLSDYVHSTSFHIKLHSSTSVDEMMFMFVNLYISLYRLVTMYCWDKADEDFDKVADKLENIFYRYIEYAEDCFHGE